MMLLPYRGRKSGQAYTVPMINFWIQDQDGEFIATTSKKGRIWWRNIWMWELTSVVLSTWMISLQLQPAQFSWSPDQKMIN